ILADLGAVERRLEKLEANIKKANRAEDVAERTLFVKMKDALEAERPLRSMELGDEERRKLRNYGFLSEKPVLLVANLGEDQVKDAAGVLVRSGLQEFAQTPGFALCPGSAPGEGG